VLHGYLFAAYDEQALARLRANGIDDPEDDPTVLVEPVHGVGPRVFLQLLPEPKVVKNRMHLDLMTDDLHAELPRLLRLNAHGAVVLSTDLRETDSPASSR